ncbi:MAG: DedA family protein [Bacteroidales bacterium]|nr:DedA family protein [Bacteroidales bacterium]
MGFTQFIANHITEFIGATGYISIFILMVMESSALPIPGEAVMPFAGFLIVQGKFTWAMVILVSTSGSIVGSYISYLIGKYGGEPFFERYGKYLLINKHHLDRTHHFFTHYGSVTIFFSRFIPVVRHLISIPAGMSTMKMPKFLLYTALGAAVWNTFLTYMGYILKQNWNEIMKYSHYIDISVIIISVLVVVFFVWQQVKNKFA